MSAAECKRRRKQMRQDKKARRNAIAAKHGSDAEPKKAKKK